MVQKLPTFSVLMPSSLVAEEPDLKGKTMKVGLVGRAMAIFRVEKAVVYDDDEPKVKDQKAEGELIATLLRYMETPQYLRKLLFRREPSLRYVGLLPPLRTPHHPLGDEKSKPGDFREAVVIGAGKRGSLLECGLREMGVVNQRLRFGQRLTVKLGEHLGKNQIVVIPVSKIETGEYWGYEVLRTEDLKGAVEATRADFVVATSRRGGNLYEAISAITNINPASVAIVFGGPYAGLLEICERQGVEARELFDAIVNTVPEQAVKTVRTEEALIVTLALLNVLLRGR